MEKIYKELAVHLDKIPNGYPETESGVELKILKKLFSPEEASLACLMREEPETAEIIASRAGKEVRPVFLILKQMLKKGLIELKREPGQLLFHLMPFVVGFYERQNAQIDEEFAKLFEEYYRESFHRIMTIKPSVHRVIPVEQTIPLNVDVMPYQRASNYLEKALSWGVLNCICRVQKRLIGEGCDHTVENCLAFSTRSGVFERTEHIKSITKKEAFEILDQAHREGLVHTTNNVQDEVSYICNCCTCSCGILRGFAEYGSPESVARSDFYAKIDAELCDACENCLTRCQFNALQIIDDCCMVDLSKCFGCGLCVTECPSEAIFLLKKQSGELEPPPKTEKDWKAERTISRQKATG